MSAAGIKNVEFSSNFLDTCIFIPRETRDFGKYQASVAVATFFVVFYLKHLLVLYRPNISIDFNEI